MLERRGEAFDAHDLALRTLIGELDPDVVKQATKGVHTMSQRLLEQEGF